MVETAKDRSKDLNEPLLTKDDESRLNGKPNFAPISYPDALKKISSLAFIPIIAFLFNPAYHIVNSIILG